jgi:hypothetical protein
MDKHVEHDQTRQPETREPAKPHLLAVSEFCVSSFAIPVRLSGRPNAEPSSRDSTRRKPDRL